MARKMLVDGEVAAVADAGQYDYDLFVIGAGSGGVRGSRFAASFGAKVCWFFPHHILSILYHISGAPMPECLLAVTPVPIHPLPPRSSLRGSAASIPLPAPPAATSMVGGWHALPAAALGI